MERILVSLDLREASLGAVHRAIHLAARIRATVSILLVSDGGSEVSGKDIFKDLEPSVRKRLELMVEMGRSEGLAVNTYVAQGDFEEEVIRFVEENGISLLVLGFPEKESENLWEFMKSLRAIRKRVGCSIELVHPKDPSSLDEESAGSKGK